MAKTSRKNQKTKTVEADTAYTLEVVNRSTADKAYEQEEYERALELYSRIIDEKGPGAVLLNNRGLCFYALKDYSNAIIDFTEAIELDPTFINAWNNRGLTFQKMGEVEKAADDFYKADSLDPQYSLEGTHVMPKLN